jgi:TM2 domain-containing membrane protein YozV
VQGPARINDDGRKRHREKFAGDSLSGVTTPPPPLPAPGWYPDPEGAPGQRYFDGAGWTDHRATPQPAYLVPQPAYPPAAYQAELILPKSAVAAGLLQLFFGWFGIGRFYIGSTAIAAIQLVLGLIGIITSPIFGLGLVILVPLSIWTFIDAIIMFAGGVTDSEGRKLR